ncbi:MAG: dihydrodipicolinate synthetase family protein [Rhodoferax sp.]|nr:dihydrodipicolinate synthetase family protein [Rhodoferax sp.]
MTFPVSGVGGIWPATLTPFGPDGNIDDAELARHVAEVASTPGVRAVVVNGHAGETSSLNRAERAQVVRIAVQAAGAVPVVAGVVAEDPRDACALAADAAEAGASALLLFPPAMFGGGAALRPEMILRYVRQVANAAPLPTVLFQLSRASNQAFSTEMLVRLCNEVPQIAAIKEGSDVPELFEDNLRAIRRLDRPVAMLASNNSWLFASLAYGADGILSGIGSVVAPLLVELHAAVAAGKLDAARAVNDRLVPLCRVFYRAPTLDVHNRMKTALHLLGRLSHPAPRLPLLPVYDDETLRIRAALIAAGLLDNIR